MMKSTSNAPLLSLCCLLTFVIICLLLAYYHPYHAFELVTKAQSFLHVIVCACLSFLCCMLILPNLPFFILKGVDLIDHTSIFLLHTINNYTVIDSA